MEDSVQLEYVRNSTSIHPACSAYALLCSDSPNSNPLPTAAATTRTSCKKAPVYFLSLLLAATVLFQFMVELLPACMISYTFTIYTNVSIMIVSTKQMAMPSLLIRQKIKRACRSFSSFTAVCVLDLLQKHFDVDKAEYWKFRFH